MDVEGLNVINNMKKSFNFSSVCFFIENLKKAHLKKSNKNHSVIKNFFNTQTKTDFFFLIFFKKIVLKTPFKTVNSDKFHFYFWKTNLLKTNIFIFKNILNFYSTPINTTIQSLSFFKNFLFFKKKKKHTLKKKNITENKFFFKTTTLKKKINMYYWYFFFKLYKNNFLKKNNTCNKIRNSIIFFHSYSYLKKKNTCVFIYTRQYASFYIPKTNKLFNSFFKFFFKKNTRRHSIKRIRRKFRKKFNNKIIFKKQINFFKKKFNNKIIFNVVLYVITHTPTWFFSKSVFYKSFSYIKHRRSRRFLYRLNKKNKKNKNYYRKHKSLKKFFKIRKISLFKYKLLSRIGVYFKKSPKKAIKNIFLKSVTSRSVCYFLFFFYS